MAQVKFVTMKGSNTLTATPYYIGIVQHERTMGKREAYEFLAQETGYRAAAIRAVFMALRDYIRENADKGNITFIDGVASIRNVVKGPFQGLTGPWVKGVNHLAVNAVELDPFKSVLADILPSNKTDGAKPVIYTVLDDVTGVYDVITGTDAFSIAGADLAPDDSKDDEYICFVGKDGVEHRATITFSDLQNVKAALPAPLPAGEYTLAVYTRSGLGSEFGVAKVTRKVMIG